MDIEKYTSGKLYSFFEWVFRLAVWNLLLMLITCAVMAIPYFAFYKIQDNNSLVSVELIDEYDLKVIQKIRTTTLSEVLKISENDYQGFDKKENIIDEKNKNYTYIINMSKFYVSYTLDENYSDILFEDMKLIGVSDSGNIIITDTIIPNLEAEYKIDRDRYLICEYDDVKYNFGVVVETQSTLSTIFLLIAIIIGLFVFIPCFVTVFSMIKIYGENQGSNVIILFFDRLWDNFKSLYKLLLIMIPVICIFVFATYYYYSIISNENYQAEGNWIYVLDIFRFSYNFLLVSLILAFLWLLNLPMTLAYFRMRTKDIFKFTFSMTFKNILYTFIYLFTLLIPILICVIYPLVLPMWFIFGISVPLYICHLTCRSKYRYLARNIEEINREMKENTEIYRFSEQEKGDNYEIRN